MEHIIDNRTRTTPAHEVEANIDESGPAYQAYQILRIASED